MSQNQIARDDTNRLSLILLLFTDVMNVWMCVCVAANGSLLILYCLTVAIADDDDDDDDL